MSHWWPVQWSVVQKRCFHGAAGGLGEGPVLGCFCVRLLASWRSWFFVSLNFGGVCWRWLAPHLRAQNSPRLRKRCRQCTPTYLIMKVMSKTAFARAKVDSLAHAGTTCPSWHKLRLTCVHTGMLLHWSGPFLCDLGMAPSSSGSRMCSYDMLLLALLRLASTTCKPLVQCLFPPALQNNHDIHMYKAYSSLSV